MYVSAPCKCELLTAADTVGSWEQGLSTDEEESVFCKTKIWVLRKFQTDL